MRGKYLPAAHETLHCIRINRKHDLLVKHVSWSLAAAVRLALLNNQKAVPIFYLLIPNIFAGFIHACIGASCKNMSSWCWSHSVCNLNVYFKRGRCHWRSVGRWLDSTSWCYQGHLQQFSSLVNHMQSQLLTSTAPSWPTSWGYPRCQEHRYWRCKVKLKHESPILRGWWF